MLIVVLASCLLVYLTCFIAVGLGQMGAYVLPFLLLSSLDKDKLT
jgi:hypothetical protein